MLVHFASILHQVVRDGDLVARLGGEEFAVLLVETTVAQARSISERARSELEGSSIEAGAGEPLRITVSVGVAALHDDPAQVMEAADAVLYQAKHGGRNRVMVAD